MRPQSVLAFALLAAACAAPATPISTGTSGSEVPKPGGTLILGQRDTPENMNWYQGVFASQVVFQQFYEPLVAFDQRVDYRIDFPIIPWLAESWEQPDEKTWMLKIRDGVKWHDGSPLTAEGVVWSLEYLRNPNNRFPARTNIATVTGVAAVENKVRFTLNAATPNFLAGVREIPILPKHIFDAGGAEALNTRSAGTGAFALASMDRSSRTVFTKFPGYWAREDGRQLPYLDGIQFIHNMDMSAQQAAFAAGQLDIYNFSDKAQLDAFLARVKDVKVVKFQYALDPALPFNFKRPHMDKLEVRKALHLIVNRQDLNESFAGGEAIFSVPAVPAIKEGWAVSQEELLKRPGWRPNKADDLAEARRLLERAGVPRDWEIRLINRATFGNAAQGEIAGNQLKQAGLKVDYRALDDATFVREQREGSFDLMLELRANPNVPARAFDWYHTRGPSNTGKLSDPDVDAIIDRLQGAVDPADQKRLGKQLQELLLERVYELPLVTPAIYNLLQPWVGDWRPNHAIQVHLYGAAPFLWIDTERLPAGRK